MNYYEDFVNRSITHGVCCHKSVNLGSFAAFCKEESSPEKRIFHFYIEEDMHDADIGDMKQIVKDHFAHPIFIFFPHVPKAQIKQMLTYAKRMALNENRENSLR